MASPCGRLAPGPSQFEVRTGALQHAGGGSVVTADPYHPPARPPIQPREFTPSHATSSWPTVIGVIAIVLGALAVLGELAGSAAVFLLDTFPSAVPQARATAMEAVQQLGFWVVADSLLCMGAAALLVAVGIGLLRRRHWAVRTASVWAWFKILLVAADAAVTYPLVKAQCEAAFQQMSGIPGVPARTSELMTFGALALVLVWGWAWPVFLLIWLARREIRAETSAWR
jgi:hypothetical protein